MTPIDLQSLREKIDHIDNDIIRLFEKRMNVVTEISAFKKANNIPVLDSNREGAKLQAVSAKVPQELESYARALFETLFELSRSYQESMKAK